MLLGNITLQDKNETPHSSKGSLLVPLNLQKKDDSFKAF